MIGLGLGIPYEQPLEVGFSPLDIGDLLIYYDFTSYVGTDKNYVTKSDPQGKLTAEINDNIPSSGAVSFLRLKSGAQLETSLCPDAGIVKVNSEYFSYSGYTSSGSDVSILLNVTRARAGSSEEAHSSGDALVVISGSYADTIGGASGSGSGLRDFTDFELTEMRIPNLGSAGGYVTLSDDPLTRPGFVTTELGTTKKPVLQFDGTNDRLPLNATVTTSSGNFSVVIIFRAEGGPSSDAVIGGSSAGINQFKINANTILFRCNSTGSSNAFGQIRANNTTAYSVGSRGGGTTVDKGAAGNSFLDNQNEFLAFIKEKNTTDNKEKVYLYDIQDLIAEDLMNNSGVAGQSGYPDNSENPSNTGFEIAHIGALSNDTGDFSGELAEVLIYDKALTDAEIKLLQSYYDKEYANLDHE